MNKTKILITGANGFIGKNLVARLNTMGNYDVIEYTLESTASQLEKAIVESAFIFHLAGINRPSEASEFYTGNADLTQQIVDILLKYNLVTPILLTSTIQVGNGSDYAKSKEQAEQTIEAYGQVTQAPIYIYRLPGVFGKWSKPNYNTVVATFCHNITRELPITISNPDSPIALTYIDDVVDAFIATMQQQQQIDITAIYDTTVGQLADKIQGFRAMRTHNQVNVFADDLTVKLYATYLSFLPKEQFGYDLTMHTDSRGSFSEFLRIQDGGQISINVTKPGISKGNHWHDTKNEKFLVVAGQAEVQFRKYNTTEIIRYTVSGDQLKVIDIPTGYIHSIKNIGDTDMVMVIWASEWFEPSRPDTHAEEI